MHLIAHRGASATAPENTLSAFRLAWEAGADGVELDVRLSGDGDVVVLHDENTLRTTGAPLRVAETSWEQLAQLDAGAWKHPQWRGERIPLLREVLAAAPPGRIVMVEIKTGIGILPPLRAVLDAVAQHLKIVILCFVPEVLSAALRALPGYPCFLNLEVEEYTLYTPARRVAEIAAQAETAGWTGLSLGYSSSLNLEVTMAVNQHGLESAVWTVDDPATALELRRCGLDYLMTNQPGLLRPWIR